MIKEASTAPEEAGSYPKLLLMAILQSVDETTAEFKDGLQHVECLLEMLKANSPTNLAIRGAVCSWSLITAGTSRAGELDAKDTWKTIHGLRESIRDMPGLCRIPLVKHGCHTALMLLKKMESTDETPHCFGTIRLHLHRHIPQPRPVRDRIPDIEYLNCVPEQCTAPLCVRASRVLRVAP
ncbi:hypothetical protein JKP88DRAFT_218584 [Tribonema minus]|uniref:Uncharacterized protein n=1 Tax=Tribonema minus TaxID=303371 RepID=A0A835Z9H5_9STRA|nr:hypothetical protein JKP88DRAFT_218584 [Tribonema minus]